MSASARAYERLNFELPRANEASTPPEERGLARDDVRMLVAYRSTRALVSSSFRLIATFLIPGDLLVINTSATIPAALDAVARDGTSLVVHLSTQLDETSWVVELRRRTANSSERWVGAPPSRHLQLCGTVPMELVKPYGSDGRLWVARVTWPEPAIEWLTAHARPIRYDYVERAWPLATYQNVYATEYGSAEMPSAGRPFTSDVITRLVAMGVEIAPLILHCGVASLEDGERPYPERVKVSALTSERVNAARRDNRRVLAVGTTVVRALEASLGSDGHAHPYDGWTDVVVSPDSPTHLIDGLLSGWHEPVSSHLLMLEAIAGRELLENSYRTALSQDFHWHEFGDLHLILP